MTPSSTLPAFIAERLSHPRAVALGERRNGETIGLSAAEVHRRASAVAAELRARGIAAGDRVAILSENQLDWLLADFGILYAGCVVVPIFATAADDQLAFILRDSEAKLVFAGDDAAAERVRATGVAVPTVVLGRGGDGSFEAFVAAGDAARTVDAASLFAAVAPDDLAVLIYTSGTTGTPKGVMLSHRNLLSNVHDAYAGEYSGLHEGEVALSVLPLAHIYEHSGSFGYLTNLVTQYVTTPANLLDDLRAVRPQYVAFVPRIFERVLAAIVGNALKAGGARAKLVPWALGIGLRYERAKRGRFVNPLLAVAFRVADRLVLSKIKPALGLDRLRYFVSGSAPLHRDTALTLAALGLTICEGYGLTETSPVLTVNRPGDVVLGTVGPPIRNVELKIADDGEILAKGPGIMLGYYHLPPEEQPFTEDGWFRTGDIGTFQGDHLVITDRKKELFKSSGGKWIAPARIETAVKRSVFIAQVMAFGDDEPHPAVLVAPNWDLVRTELGIPVETPTAQMAADPRVRKLVIGEVEQQTADLASFEQIRRVAILPRDLTVEDGELSPTLKVRRRIVEDRYAALIRAAYEENLHERRAALGV